ncbi:MAG: phenylalanine--tRNA ligase subunit beta [Phycisphaerae bacterium]|nr:phenylalanine--tRNA ligase subunit beta [Phycisphaerae bacterium]
MKISLNWLSDYIETGLGADRIAEILSDLGFPCEGIELLDDDVVIDVEITSNRGDCLGYIGIARELAAATGKKLKMSDIELDELDKDAAEFVSVEIGEPDLCGRYTARIIDGVKVAQSPDWLRKRLEAVGVRSVNNVVDATNYAMMETGQPPHAFDYAKINDSKIIVRKARAGERLTSIDGTQCDLNTDMLVIADSQVPVGIAGVMGGLDTEVGETTATILLEDAHFDPVSIRTTSRVLTLPSEAAFRFERNVDIEMVDWASKRTAQLITQFAGGKAAKGVVDIYPKKLEKKDVTLRLSRLNKLLGIDILCEEALRILSALNFKPQSRDDLIICSVPSWRSDVYREVDLIEEVARVYGYSKVPTERKIKIEVVPVDTRQKLIESLGTYLNGCGFYETINVDFIDNSVAELFSKDDVKEHLAVKDVSRKSANLLRQTLIGSLLGVLKTNLNAGNMPCKIFEIANTFVPNHEQGDGLRKKRMEQRFFSFEPNNEQGDKLPIQKTKLALVCDSDFRDMRGVIEGLIRNIDREAQIDFTPAELIWAKTGAKIFVNSQTIGTAGIISKALKDKYDFKDILPCAVELEYEQLSALQSGAIEVKPLPRYPAIQRDLSIIVDDNIRWADIIKAVNNKATVELEDVQFVGIYQGKGIPSGKKSVTFSLRYRDEDGTLTHQRVDGFETDIVESLTKSVGAVLRTA